MTGPRKNTFQLRITFDAVQPAVWRTVRVAGDVDLCTLSRVLATAMGWDNTHLCWVRLGDVDYVCGAHTEGEAIADEVTVHDALEGVARFGFDVGARWHEVTVEARTGHRPSGGRAECVDGANVLAEPGSTQEAAFDLDTVNQAVQDAVLHPVP